MRAMIVGIVLGWSLNGCGQKPVERRVVHVVPIVMPVMVTPVAAAASSTPAWSGGLGAVVPPDPPPTREVDVLAMDPVASCAGGVSFAVVESSAVSTVSSSDPALCRRLAGGTGTRYFAAELRVQTRHWVECEPVNAVICHVTGTYVQGTIVRLVPAAGRATAELLRIALALGIPVPGTIAVD